MNDIIGVILAGGNSSRLEGFEKPLISIGGETLIDRAIRKARPQVGKLFLSVNHRLVKKLNYSMPIIPDSDFVSVGPLGGIYATLDRVSELYPSCEYVAFFAVDTPFFPDNIVSQLIEIKNKDLSKKLYCLSYQGRMQPLFSLWNISLKASLYKFLKQKKYTVRAFFDLNSYGIKELGVTNPPAFFNVNTIDDLHKLKEYRLDLF